MDALSLVAVPPLATRPVVGLGRRVDGRCQLLSTAMPQQPDDALAAGEALRTLRYAAELTMGDAARAAGLTVSQVSDLEHGRLTFGSSDDRARYLAELVAEANARS